MRKDVVNWCLEFEIILTNKIKGTCTPIPTMAAIAISACKERMRSALKSK